MNLTSCSGHWVVMGNWNSSSIAKTAISWLVGTLCFTFTVISLLPYYGYIHKEFFITQAMTKSFIASRGTSLTTNSQAADSTQKVQLPPEASHHTAWAAMSWRLANWGGPPATSPPLPCCIACIQIWLLMVLEHWINQWKSTDLFQHFFFFFLPFNPKSCQMEHGTIWMQ